MTVASVIELFAQKASPVLYHKDEGSGPCPCLTPDGYRDPEWHLANPSEPECNAEGVLTAPMEFLVQAFVQPIQSTRATRLTSEQIQALFGEVEADDHLGVFPINWNGNALDFRNWSNKGNDWIEYDGRKYTIVNVNKLPDPADGNPNHHWEVALRLIRDDS